VTAYAYGLTKNKCFKKIDGITGDDWGWTNGPYGQGRKEILGLWAAYGLKSSCIPIPLVSGTPVGTVIIDYDEKTVTYAMTPLTYMTDVAVWVGDDLLPTDDGGNYVATPSQFGNVATDIGRQITYKFENIDAFDGDGVYVAAQATVCTNFCHFNPDADGC